MTEQKKERAPRSEETLLRPRDAAVQLQISYPTIKQWLYHRKLKAVKTPGGHYRIPQSEINRLLYRTRGRNQDERRVDPFGTYGGEPRSDNALGETVNRW